MKMNTGMKITFKKRVRNSYVTCTDIEFNMS